MIYDTDLVDTLVTLIQSRSWSPQAKVADVRRVWNGEVFAEDLPPNEIVVQLWPDDQRNNRLAAASPWSARIDVGICFWTKVDSLTIAEVDQIMHTIDDLVLSSKPTLGRHLFDEVPVAATDQSSDLMTFVRQNEIGWPVRPNRERLQRQRPDDEMGIERYAGIIQVQALLTYVGLG